MHIIWIVLILIEKYYICIVVDKNAYRDEIKKTLFEKFKRENAFWSYDSNLITPESLQDDQFIAMTMRYLDLPDIDQLFTIFSMQKIKNAWKKFLVPEGDYLFTLNRFFAWYYFNAKRPDSYIKSIQTRYINSLYS